MKYSLDIQYFNDGEEVVEKAEEEVKTFTQEQVNNLMAEAKRKYKEESKATIEELKATKDAVIQYEEQIKNFSVLENQVKEYKVKEVKLNKALEYGLPIDSLDLLNGDDEETISTNALKLANLLKSSQTVQTQTINPEKKIAKSEDFGELLMKKIKGE